MPATLNDAFVTFFSRLFPRKQDVSVHVDASTDGSFVYVDARLEHGGVSHRLSDLKNIPARIKLGTKYVRVSQKNRHTLRQLADWDAAFDSRRGFVFFEKDAPEILNYLRSKASVHLAEATEHITVDNHPLEYVHDIRPTSDGVEIKTALSDAGAKIEIESPDQARFPEKSKYVHSGNGYYRKPPKKSYQTFQPELGVTALRGDQIPLFLLYDLQRLQSETRARVAPEVARQRVVTAPFEPKVSLHVNGPWIEFDVRYEADRFKIPYQQVAVHEPKQQFIREKDTWIRVDQQTHSRVSHQIDQIPEVENQQGHFRTPTRHFQEVQSLLEEVAKIDVSEAYARFYKSIQDFSQIQDCPLPYCFRGELRPYQKHGYDWVCFLRQYGLNGILADEMGLGKTVQTLTALLDAHSLPEAKTSLIICPPSVLSAWEDDLKKFTSPVDFRAVRYVGSKRENVLAALDRYDAVFTTYSIVTRDIETLTDVAWEYVILDEAQKIKNYETATAKACKRLIAKHKLALTGTPIENRLSELWSIYDFLMPSYLGSKSHFRDKYEIPVMKFSNKKAAEDLKRRINPFKLRRLKNQVATELPPKILMDRYCELTPEQVHLYKKYATQESERIKSLPGKTVKMDVSIFTALLRLKQVCCHPALVTKDVEQIYDRSGKLDAFLEILDELVENGEKALIFSQFTEMLGILRRVLDERNIEYFYLGVCPRIPLRSAEFA